MPLDSTEKRSTIFVEMSSSMPRVALVLLVEFSAFASGCRVLNPEFGDLGADSGSGTRVDDPRDDSTSPQLSDSPSDSTNIGAGSPSTERPATDSGLLDTSSPPQSSSEPKSTQSSASSSPDTSTSTTTTTTNASPAIRWDPEGPPAEPNAQATDYCAKGATTCFIVKRNSQARIASGTPGHEDIRLVIENALDLSNTEVQRSPTGFGLAFDGSATRLESEIDFPVYENQDFGFEVLYRRDANYDFVNEKKMMLMQVHRKIWLQEWRDGGTSCYLTISTGDSAEMQHVYKPPSNQMDTLRHVLCFAHNGKAHLVINGVYQFAGNGSASNNNFFEIPDREATGELTLGNWAKADKNGSLGLVPFKGVMYLARTWNNVTKMKNAVMQELPVHGFSNLDFSRFTPQ